MLDRVTLTGADNYNDPQSLVDISKEFPFVEWGILVSRRQVNSPRFPSYAWQENFAKVAMDNNLNLSCHLCGSWVNDLLLGIDDLSISPPPILEACQRLQINTHGIPHTVNDEKFLRRVSLLPVEQIIIQYDNENDQLLEICEAAGVNAAPLFDLSHGAGVLPEEWPIPVADYCGYAGGLSPENLEAQLPLIHKAAQGQFYWIDAETLVRSLDGFRFDLDRCRLFLDIAVPYLATKVKSRNGTL